MSFARVGRLQQQQTKGKRPVRPKKAPRKDWVSTVNDLSVHKLTPAELSHRHEIHKSHNKAAAQWELKERALKRRLRHAGSPAPLDQASLSIIREVFSDQLLLQDVLARSDRAMAVVEDLFGDAPRRQTGNPSVTVAPNCDSDSELPVHQKPDPPTQLSLLSQSMMDQEALNEIDDSKDECRDEDVCYSRNSETRVIRRASVRKMKPRGTQQQKVHHQEDDVPVTPCASGRAPDQMALNATVAVRRVRSKQNQFEESNEGTSALVSQVLNPELPSSQSGRTSSCTNRTRRCVSQSSELDGFSVASLSGDRSSLGLLQAMLGRVEADLETLSPDAGPESSGSPKRHRTQGLTGFSVALVSTLGRLVHVLKQREAAAKMEAEEKRKLQKELKEQRGLIDALTAETLTLREEAAALQAGLRQQTAELEQKLDAVVLVMGGLGLLGGHGSPPRDSDARDAKSTVSHSAPEETQVCVSPAVLLSPPQQSDNCQQSLVTPPAPLHRLSPVDTQSSREVLQAHGSSSSLHSAPLSIRSSSSSSLSLPSDPLRAQPSPEAMLAEIAQLSRQNELIRAQLNQAKDLRSGAAGSPNGISEQREPSPVSAGRIAPRSVGETRTSGARSTSRTQNFQSPTEKTQSQQASPSVILGVNSVEQRLLELNRQSAAARSRLLELIDLQRQNVAVRASPSASPVPPSAFSPIAADGLEESLLLPERDVLSHRRSAGSDASSRSCETGAGKTQTEKQREREGWFALSAHMR
ncbi:spindle and centriole-associated protein 1 [Kryptolebias marmoratus]|uniref:Spindle and centriole-associated protein 1 n=1 Tax=Kryptolebias marmoratus TaxID=37003 RepID=A0A3Q3FI10_KRYMA|nr:spindle and centriole-associated protein 1 [Kryptolebias marmoratus]